MVLSSSTYFVMEERRIGWAELGLKIGQKITCLRNFNKNDFYEERIDVGKTYIIEDVDLHFPYSVCIKLSSKYYSHSEFVPVELFFDEIAERRDKKLEILLKK